MNHLYFHVGTGKTGSTFLQQRVFPKIKGIHYIPTNRYKSILKRLSKINHDRVLISREFDRQLEDEVLRFSAHFPDTQPIIVFRQHDQYIASQYRRFVKNGFSGSFNDFFNIELDNGFFKISHLNYRLQIEILEKAFTKKPIVFIYDQLKLDPRGFILDLCNKIGATVELSNINFKSKHKSYSNKQLLYFRLISKHINLRKRRIFKNQILHFVWRIYLGTIRYTLLFIAKFLPWPKAESRMLIQPTELEKIKNYFKGDWQFIVEYNKSKPQVA